MLIRPRGDPTLRTAALVEAIRRIREEGTTLLVADQNVKFARRVADRGYIMERGTVSGKRGAQGPAGDVDRA